MNSAAAIRDGRSIVAGYFRVSQARDGMKAPEIYTDEIERYCRYRQLDLGQIFSDIDYSGFRGARPRPALENLKSRRYEFSSVIVPKLSRFGRSVKDLVALFDLFDRDSIALIFLDMNVDTSTSQGRLLRHILAAFAEYESDVKADYARANHRSVRAQGRPWGGRPPFGYEHHPTERSFMVHPQRALIVRSIFRDYLGGDSQYAISRRLNSHGLTRPSGASWTTQQIGKILDNPAYAALCIVDEDFITGVWEPIIERPVWDQVRVRRAGDKRRHRGLRLMKGGPYLLSGMLYCGICGNKLHHRTKEGKHNGIYVCIRRDGRWCESGSIDSDRADDYVAQRFLDRCQFSIEGRPDMTFRENEKAWAKATIEERRRLLSMVVARVILVLGDRGPSVLSHIKGKTLNIEWVDGIRGTTKVALVAGPEKAPRTKSEASRGRSEMMRQFEVTEREKKSAARSERAKNYYRDWSRHRESFCE